MNMSFGIYARPSSTQWNEIRKGPSLDAVREHIDRVVNFGRYSGIAGDPGIVSDSGIARGKKGR